MSTLSAERRVIAFDIPGFGATPSLGNGIVPTVPEIAASLGETLSGLGITQPVDIAGNSLGGYLALEAAKKGLAKSVVGISPAGLWHEQGALYVKHLFYAMRFGAQHFPYIARLALGIPLLRELLLAAPISVGSRHMPTDDAIRVLEDLANSKAFKETFSNTGAFKDGRHLKIPITIAFGTRDWILPRSSQMRDQLPAHTSWVRPSGWGHVPMWMDAEGVARLILDGTAQK